MLWCQGCGVFFRYDEKSIVEKGIDFDDIVCSECGEELVRESPILFCTSCSYCDEEYNLSIECGPDAREEDIVTLMSQSKCTLCGSILCSSPAKIADLDLDVISQWCTPSEEELNISEYEKKHIQLEVDLFSMLCKRDLKIIKSNTPANPWPLEIINNLLNVMSECEYVTAGQCNEIIQTKACHDLFKIFYQHDVETLKYGITDDGEIEMISKIIGIMVEYGYITQEKSDEHYQVLSENNDVGVKLIKRALRKCKREGAKEFWTIEAHSKEQEDYSNIIKKEVYGEDKPQLRIRNKDEWVKFSEEQYYTKVKQIIENNPGIFQRDLGKQGIDTSIFSCLERLGYIKREKFKNSFKLFLTGNENRAQIRKFLFLGSRAQIPINRYPNGIEQIYVYFGKEVLEKLFKVYEDPKEILPMDDFRDFCYVVGGCVKFDINDSLKEVINKYWDDTCDNKLNMFYIKYGFFSSKAFIDYRLEEVIGEDSLIDFYGELEARAGTFSIKWCGGPGSFITSNSIPLFYAEYLKFKFGIKPDLVSKKCTKCGKSFYAINYFVDPGLIEKMRNYAIEKNISGIEVCPKHLP